MNRVIGTASLHLGDCLEVLRSMADNSVDSIVTDPPYGLNFMGKKWDYDVPSVEIWAECLRVIKPGGHLLAFAGTRTQHRMACRIEDAGFEIRDMIAWVYGSGFPKSHNGEWGGTALKPALEPITMARKPLIGTVAANVAAHGTGGLNIDGCRVPIDQDADASQLRTMQRSKREADDGWGMSSVSGDIPSVVRTDGRWPANLIHDGSSDVVAAFPDSNGSGTARVLKRCAKTENNGWGMNTTAADFAHLPDAGTGSAARFFYCAKASKKDRGDGNGHPTVKPTDLMAYLCRLVTPPGGVVLDPFMGSGSTGKAAVREGFAFIGIEREADYLRIATARIEAQMCTSRAESGPPPQNDLFSESLRA